MPDNNELLNMLRSVIQEELKPINDRLVTLEQGQKVLEAGQVKLTQGQKVLEAGQVKLSQSQDRLENKVDKLEMRMESEVIEKIRALFDGYSLRGDQIENLQKHLDQRLDSIETDVGYLVSRVVRLEEIVK